MLGRNEERLMEDDAWDDIEEMVHRKKSIEYIRCFIDVNEMVYTTIIIVNIPFILYLFLHNVNNMMDLLQLLY